MDSFDIGLDNNFLNLRPKAQATKAKPNKSKIKLKASATARETINKAKRHLCNGRKYLQTMYLIRG